MVDKTTSFVLMTEILKRQEFIVYRNAQRRCGEKVHLK